MKHKQGILKEHSSLLVTLVRTIDLTVIVVTAIVVNKLYFGEFEVSTEYKHFVALSVLATFISFSHYDLYQPRRGFRAAKEIRAITVAWSVSILFSSTLFFFSASFLLIQPNWLALWASLSWISLLFYRMGLRLTLRWLRSQGYNQRSIVLVGLSERSLHISNKLKESQWTGFSISGYFDDRNKLRSEVNPNLPHLGTLSELADYVESNRIDQVWITYPLKAEDRVSEVLHQLRHTTAEIKFTLDIFGFTLCNHSMNDVVGIPVLNLSSSPMVGMNTFMKAFEDRLLAFIILLLVSPLMLGVSIGVKLSSPGPVFYRQERLSWNGKPFYMYKFRSMPTDAESGTGAVWAKKGENRATKFGSFLRKTSLDELPQFINVLKGDMSIVGPRPERPVFVDEFKDKIPYYMKKHLVKAGITGWAQVNGWRGETDLSSRIQHDIYYIENWSLWFDIRIVFLTLYKGFINRNAY